MVKLPKVISLFFALVFVTLAILFLPAKIYAQSILFQDDFESGNLDNWQVINGLWNITSYNGSNWLEVNAPSGSDYEIQAGQFNWTNYEFSFDFIPLSGIDRNFFFRVQDQRTGILSGHNLPVAWGMQVNHGSSYIAKWTSDSITVPSPAILFPISFGVPIKVSIIVENENIKANINDSPTPIEWSDLENSLLSGRIALAAITGNSPSHYLVDNVIVKSLATPTPTPNPTPSPSPTANTDTTIGSFELPFNYPGRLLGSASEFKSAFWSRLTASFDHLFVNGTFRPFTGNIYMPSDCSSGVLGISCYDSHNGTDFSQVGGLNVYSVAGGKVVYATNYVGNNCISDSSGFGCVSIVKYPGNNYGLYAHLSKVFVRDGDTVTSSTLIGEMGNTGCSGCGTHLHFGVMRPVNLTSGVSLMKRNDWRALLLSIRPSSAPRYQAFCTYTAPNGASFAFEDPSGWNGGGKDPWSIPRSKGGCGTNSHYLWLFDVGNSL